MSDMTLSYVKESCSVCIHVCVCVCACVCIYVCVCACVRVCVSFPPQSFSSSSRALSLYGPTKPKLDQIQITVILIFPPIFPPLCGPFKLSQLSLFLDKTT